MKRKPVLDVKPRNGENTVISLEKKKSNTKGIKKSFIKMEQHKISESLNNSGNGLK